jgi:hypothetical protein
MATRDASWLEWPRARLDGWQPRRYPKHSGRKAGEALDRMSIARTTRPTTDGCVAGQQRLRGES